MDDEIRILHVDDEADFADLSGAFLEREDERFTVETATRASEGLNRLAERDFDCIVSDYEMPDTNGIEFLETVREDDPNLPFILFTGKGSEEVASDAISADVTDYLQKEHGTEQYAILANRVANAVERRRTERQRRRQLQAIEAAHEGISILDETGRFIFVNEAYANLYGYEPGTLIGEHWEYTYPDEDVEFVYETILPAVSTNGYWQGETTGLRADGTTFPERHTVAGTEYDELVCAVRDIAAEKERERQLEDLTGFRDAVIDSANVWINVLDSEGNVVIWNEAAEEISGYSAHDVVGHGKIWKWLYPDESYRTEILDHVSEILNGEKAVEEFETTITTKGGDERIISWNQNLILSDDRLEGAVAIARDVTEHKKRKQQLERFASIVSHDLRNPLNVAALRLELAREEYDSNHFDAIAQALNRMDTLIEDLLGLTREGESLFEPEAVDVAETVRECWRHVVTENARLEVTANREIRADRSRFKQLVENLVRNAVEHGGDGVTITVGELDGGFYVEDDGPGIPSDELDAVLETGYSTSADGIGLGLSIVQRIAAAHDWEVDVTPGSDGGARFEFTDVESVQ
ncbi:PAS domain S-box protein [Halobacteria archaeon AArc-m2/3/4]|uniref:histidine kinase n=1 Tax=Natronoglomus mannanivorans TaxID=2979990 RepID=A0ABT2QKA6_9EURY|nr:PAS domain S-box protein [Halobacteria archaeon AArc-m2/3/4]